MALISQADFARMAGVSKAAITQARDRGRLRVDAHGMVDTDSALAQEYLRYPRSQRRVAQQRKHRQEEALCRNVEAWWASGALPEGWAVLALADLPDENGMVTPLYFYPPNRPMKAFPLQSDKAPDYEVDLDRGCGFDSSGVAHPLTLRTFGVVSWVDRALASVSGRKSAGQEPPIEASVPTRADSGQL